jgi:drug/metabolite transporter (DMT)-like permease
MFLGGIQLTILAYLTGQHIPIRDINWEAWTAISYLVVIGSVITFAAFIHSLKRLPVSQVSIHAYINPIVAVIVGSILNHEKLNGTIALGTVVTILGVYLVNTGFRRVKISKEIHSDVPVDDLAKE